MTGHDLAAELGFRDLGGLATADGRQVRTGLVFRSAVPRDADERRKVLDEAGIRGVCDLRGGRGDPVPGPSPAPGDHVVPLTYVPWSLGGHDRAQIVELLTAAYVRAAEQTVIPGSPLSQAVRHVVLDARRPTVVWCTGGRDRTGMVIALTLHLLGVTDCDIADDYARGAGALAVRVHGERVRAAGVARPPRNASERRARLRDSARRFRLQDLAPLQHAAPRDPILAFLDEVRKLGAVAGGARVLGIGAAELTQAKAALLAPPSQTSPPVERTGHHAH